PPVAPGVVPPGVPPVGGVEQRAPVDAQAEPAPQLQLQGVAGALVGELDLLVAVEPSATAADLELHPRAGRADADVAVVVDDQAGRRADAAVGEEVDRRVPGDDADPVPVDLRVQPEVAGGGDGVAAPLDHAVLQVEAAVDAERLLGCGRADADVALCRQGALDGEVPGAAPLLADGHAALVQQVQDLVSADVQPAGTGDLLPGRAVQAPADTAVAVDGQGAGQPDLAGRGRAQRRRVRSGAG